MKKTTTLAVLLAFGLSGSMAINLSAARKKNSLRRKRTSKKTDYKLPWYERLRQMIFGAPKKRSKWLDSMGQRVWKMRNDSPFTLTIKTDIATKKIKPKETKMVRRLRGFGFMVTFTKKGEKTVIKKPFGTKNHSIRFYGKHELKMKSYAR